MSSSEETGHRDNTASRSVALVVFVQNRPAERAEKHTWPASTLQIHQITVGLGILDPGFRTYTSNNAATPNMTPYSAERVVQTAENQFWFQERRK